MGRAPGLVHGRLGRLEISWDTRGRPGEDDGGLAVEAAVVEPSARLLFALAGPFANLLAAALLVPSYAALSGVPRICLAVIITASLLMAAWSVPSKSPGSDGREALSALRGRDDTAA